MRIRSVHPEFWRSEDVAAMDWTTRLVFIGLWSYVDDNGVGRDVERLIVAELFPLEDDPRETLATVSRALQTLSDGGQISRYSVGGKPYLHVAAWKRWQKIDRPGKERYPLPTCDVAEPRDTLATLSRTARDTPSTGEGEKGRRGEGEKTSCASADAERGGRLADDFAAWWQLYPRKRSKGHAEKAYRAARKKADAETLLAALLRDLNDFRSREPDKVPYPATWLNGERWDDVPDEAIVQPVRHLPHAVELERPPDGLSPAEYAAWERERRERRGA